MRCEKCGYVPNPGDQICINCGAKLSLDNAIVPEVEIQTQEENIKDNKKFIIIISLGILALIIVVFLIIKFFVLKG
jgi:uncharacterized membrane protein YvbJ